MLVLPTVQKFREIKFSYKQLITLNWFHEIFPKWVKFWLFRIREAWQFSVTQILREINFVEKLVTL